MSYQPRTIKVWLSLVGAMTFGATILMALDSQKPAAGPFSLASYTKLKAVDDVLGFNAQAIQGRWDKIEVYYSNTEAGDINTLALFGGLTSSEEVNVHFVVCNGDGGEDGLIQPSYRWQNQYPCLAGDSWYGSRSTIRICVIADGKGVMPTDIQIKRSNIMIDALCMRFGISPVNIDYPQGWQP